MTAWYNEIDDYAADWLENLIAAGLIAPGVVDRRSIEDVRPADLHGFAQCHFFAGIGVWSYALRLAGWPDDRPVWTGSCPCQPFSAAGKGEGVDDPRHLWPAWVRLIRECRPTECLGEQVASKDGLGWADIVQADLEGADYACGFVDTCSAGHGAPHIRQRLRFAAYDLRSSAGWVAQPERPGLERHGGHGNGGGEPGRVAAGPDGPASAEGAACGLAYADGGDPGAEGLQRGREHGQQPEDGGAFGRLADAERHGRGEHRAGVGGAAGAGEGRPGERERLRPDPANGGATGRSGPLHGFWRDADWLLCRDGKWRPAQPGTFPLAHGAPARVGRLRAYGNAVDAQATTAFVTAYLEATERA